MYDQEILAVAARQDGIISVRAACDLGWTERRIRHLVQRGLVVRVAPGVLRAAGAPDTWRSRVRAATLSVPGAVASHESAAQLHGLGPVDADAVVVLGPVGTSSRSTAARVHRTRRLHRVDITEVDGIDATTPGRTVCDLAAVLRMGRLARVIDAGLADDRLEIEELKATFESQKRRGRPGRRMLRTLLEERGPDHVPPESELEAAFDTLVRRAGLPRPVRQFRAPWLASERGRIDFAWPRRHLVVEVDGRSWHRRDEQFECDRERDAMAVANGFRPLRFTWRQVVHRAPWVREVLEAALRDGPPEVRANPAA